ncbi:MAG: UvrD-helicase domain-containing protein [Actinomycetia bacterium]|nr:UvrD-helicase domain-containing protein [Actinomycetes bacterium]
MTPDQDTRDLITIGGLDRTLFVEAGAGSGKTTQLVTRIVNLVLERGVRLSALAAITFTEAAAAELQSRIRVEFEKTLARATDPLRVERGRQALADADLAAISTLHGFASRLLNEYAVEAGLPPRVRVLDDVSSQLAHEERWGRFVDQLHADPANQELLTRAILLRIALEPAYPGHITMKDIAAALNQNYDRLADIQLDPPPLGPLDFSVFDEAVALVQDLPASCLDEADKYCQFLLRAIPEMVGMVDTADPHRKVGMLAALPTKGWGRGAGGQAGNWPHHEIPQMRDQIEAVTSAARAVVETANNEVLHQLTAKVADHVLDGARQRREEGGLEFHDLLVLARDMLRHQPQARESLHRRFTHLLLDEFQDTDPLQIEMAVLIAAGIHGEGWGQAEVDQGRLFFVGDPKQSIYRFRRADIALFLEARERFGPDGTWARLTTNFRTVEPIVDWVNAYFAQSMADESQGQPRYEPLAAFRTADSGAGIDHRPLLLGGPHPDPKVRAPRLRATEAEHVARVVADVRDRPGAWPVGDPAAERGWRQARISDITILVPTRTSLPYLRVALEEHDLPYRLATGTLVYDSQDVRDALAALRAIDDPSDSLNLVAALRSPLYACSDVDLFQHRQAGGRWDLRRSAPELLPDDHPVSVGLTHLRSLWEDRWWTSPSDLLSRLLVERQAALVAFGDSRPAEVWRRLRFLVDQARSFEEAGGGDLRAFLDWAALQGDDGARVHEPLLPETDDDALRIMTVHGSKGLEFPITILSGMTTQPARARRGPSVEWHEGRPEVRLSSRAATSAHQHGADFEAEMNVLEKERLLYVAATRARDHLVVACHHRAEPTEASATYASKLWTFFEGHPYLWRASEITAADIEDEPEAAARVADTADGTEPAPAGPDPEREAWITARTALIAPHRQSRAVSATTIARAATESPGPTTVEPDEDDDGADLDDTATVPVRRRGRAGSAIGRAVHATLQVIDLTDPGPLEAIIGRECDIESIPEHVGVVAAMVRSALGSEAVGAIGASVHHKELFVAAPVGGQVIEGYVDLLIEGPDGLVVVDWKTDSVPNEAAVEAKLAGYELQAGAYAVALEEITGQPVVDCRFVFCRPSGAIERSVADLPATKARVRASLGNI